MGVSPNRRLHIVPFQRQPDPMPNTTKNTYRIRNPHQFSCYLLGGITLKSITIERRPDLDKTLVSAEVLGDVSSQFANYEIEVLLSRASDDAGVRFQFDPADRAVHAVMELPFSERDADEMQIVERFDLHLTQGAPELFPLRAA
jgi:hypothetical protein